MKALMFLTLIGLTVTAQAQTAGIPQEHQYIEIQSANGTGTVRQALPLIRDFDGLDKIVLDNGETYVASQFPSFKPLSNTKDHLFLIKNQPGRREGTIQLMRVAKVITRPGHPGIIAYEVTDTTGTKIIQAKDFGSLHLSTIPEEQVPAFIAEKKNANIEIGLPTLELLEKEGMGERPQSHATLVKILKAMLAHPNYATSDFRLRAKIFAETVYTRFLEEAKAEAYQRANRDLEVIDLIRNGDVEPEKMQRAALPPETTELVRAGRGAAGR
jgi:hypothetical protein